ncbi:oxidoreductase [uncultured Demequina sp.]|uniref:oxidoreductase n=1 Tax=uncultured Demequina sp. TaxID=693499 RepID=UPI0025F427A0|nr:oxidoreductase [uncultured Demequina sp.]
MDRSFTTTQSPIGSGFGARTTAAEVLAGLDLKGSTAVVTGGYSGLGLEITRALVGAGARVLVPARRVDVAADAVAGIDGPGSVEVAAMDLSDQDSVAAYADALLAAGTPLDMLIANAGVMACPETRVGPGWEAQFATNHLGHFALVARLWPLLVDGGARVIMVSSDAHHGSGIRWEDLHFTSDYDPWDAYGQSKTANVLMAVHLDALGRDHGVRAFALHPGAILTPLQRHLPRQEMVDRGWIDDQGRGINPHFKSVEAGAATATWAATSPQLAGLGGVYLADCDVVAADQVEDWATDPDEAARLWSYSAAATGVDLPG